MATQSLFEINRLIRTRQSKYNDEYLKKVIMDMLKCCRCELYVHTDIKQCCNGHILCHHCALYKTTCQECFGQVSCVRPKLLEKFLPILDFPCRYTKQGCVYSGKYPDIATHENTCTYVTYIERKCNNDECEWTGHHSHVLYHYMRHHPHSLDRYDDLYVMNYTKNHADKFETRNIMHYDEKLFQVNLVVSKEGATCSATNYEPFFRKVVEYVVLIAFQYKDNKSQKFEVNFSFSLDGNLVPAPLSAMTRDSADIKDYEITIWRKSNWLFRDCNYNRPHRRCRYHRTAFFGDFPYFMLP